MARRKQTDMERLQADFRALQDDAAALTHDARKVLGSSVNDGLSTVSDGLSQLRVQMDNGMSQVADYAGHTARSTSGWAQSRPFANLVGAFALGIAVGSLAIRRAARPNR